MHEGSFDGLKEQGIEERVNLEVRRAHAQAEIANIPLLIRNYDASDVDVINTMTTPVLVAAAFSARSKPVVFTYVYDPIAAGVGKSRTDRAARHRCQFVPAARGYGRHDPAAGARRPLGRNALQQRRSQLSQVVGVARGIFEQRGIKLQEIAITGTSEILQAAQVMTQRGVQALWVTGDTALQGFDAIVRAARDAKLPSSSTTRSSCSEERSSPSASAAR